MASTGIRRPRVRLSEPTSPKLKRPRVRLSPPTEEELISQFIKKNGVTKCPTKSVESVRNLYPIKAESARINHLEVQAEKDPERQQKLKDQRMRILKKTEAWILLLKREGKPIPKGFAAVALRQA